MASRTRRAHRVDAHKLLAFTFESMIDELAGKLAALEDAGDHGPESLYINREVRFDFSTKVTDGNKIEANIDRDRMEERDG